MSENTNTNDKRAQKVCLLGFVTQVLFTAGLWFLAIRFQSETIELLARLMLVGIPVWFVLYLLFTQMWRVGAESLETAELKRAQAAGEGESIFEFDDEALLLEQNRLRWMIKWLLPGTSVAVSLVLLLGNLVGFSWSFDSAFEDGVINGTVEPTMMMWFIVAIGVACYAFARYSIALAKIPAWRVIRAGATLMQGNAIACLIVALSLMASGKMDWAEPLVAYALRAGLLLLGIEFAMNFVLDMYRPRSPGEIPRPSFDSRLLGLVTEPGGIAKSVAEAVNYQFGFEVSATWFYQLLQKWLLPIIVLSAIAIMLLSSVVIVEPHEQVVIERFGKRVGGDDTKLTPGLYFKWPFPVDIVYRAPVNRVDSMVIGEAGVDDGHDDHAGKPSLWTEKHEYVPELMLLVASQKDEDLAGDTADTVLDEGDFESAPVSLLMVSTPIEYRINNIHNFLYRYDDPRKLMEAEAYRLLSNHAAGVDIADLMGPGREDFNNQFQANLQKRLDELQVGIDVVFAGISDAHPPAQDKVAEAFQNVIRAEIQRNADVNNAHGEATKLLVQTAGTVRRAEELDAAINELNEIKKQDSPDAAALAVADAKVEALLLGDDSLGIAAPGGEVAEVIADAGAEASQAISKAARKVRSFAMEVVAFEAAPELYLHRKQLEIFENLGYIRRYLIAGDPDKVIVTYSTEEEAALDKVLADDGSGH